MSLGKIPLGKARLKAKNEARWAQPEQRVGRRMESPSSATIFSSGAVEVTSGTGMENFLQRSDITWVMVSGSISPSLGMVPSSLPMSFDLSRT